MNLSPSNVDDVHKLALEHVTPFVRWGGEARVDRSLIKLLSRLGLVAPFFATEFGGSGDGRVCATLLCSYREDLVRASPEASTALAMPAKRYAANRGQRRGRARAWVEHRADDHRIDCLVQPGLNWPAWSAARTVAMSGRIGFVSGACSPACARGRAAHRQRWPEVADGESDLPASHRCRA